MKTFRQRRQHRIVVLQLTVIASYPDCRHHYVVFLYTHLSTRTICTLGENRQYYVVGVTLVSKCSQEFTFKI